MNSYIEKIIYFTIFFIPFSFALNLQKDVDIAFLRVVISLAFLIFLFYLIYKNKPILLNRFKNKQTYFFSIFFIWAGVSAFWALNPVWSVRKFVFFATIVPIYFLIIYLINSKEKINKISQIFIFSGFLASLVGVFQFFSQFVFSLDKIYNFWAYEVSMFLYGQNFGSIVIANQSWFVNIGGKDYFRAISLFPDPHTFALYLGILIPFTIGFFFYTDKKNKAVFFLQIITMLLALLFTFSRGAYIGFLLSFIFIVIFYFHYFKVKINKKVAVSASLIFLIFISVFATSVFSQRFISSFSLSDISNAGRIQIWKTSTDVFLQNPVLGVGLGNLPVFFDPKASVKSPINAHNTYLDILSELGLIGISLFFAFLFSLFKNLFFKKDEFDFLKIGILWSLVWFLTHSFFETSLFSVPVLISFCFIVAISVVLKNFKKLK